MNPRENLKAYLDGELPPLQMAEMREAIERDTELAREANELQSISLAMRAAAPISHAKGLDDTLRAIARHRRPRYGWLALPLGLAGAAVLLAVFLKPDGMSDAAAFRVTGEASEAAGSKSMDRHLSEPRAEAAKSAPKAISPSNGSGGIAVELKSRPKTDATTPASKEREKAKVDETRSRLRATNGAATATIGQSTSTGTVTLASSAPSPPPVSSSSLNRVGPKAVAEREGSSKYGKVDTKTRGPAQDAKQATAPIVIEAESVADAEAQLRTVVAPYQTEFEPDHTAGGKATLGMAGSLLYQAPKTAGTDLAMARVPERVIVLRVPESRAQEAVKAIRLLGDSVKVPVRDSNVAGTRARSVQMDGSSGVANSPAARGGGPPLDQKGAATKGTAAPLGEPLRGGGGPGGIGGGGGFAGGAMNGSFRKDMQKPAPPTRRIVVILRPKLGPKPKSE